MIEKKRLLIGVAVAAVIILAILPSLFFYNKYQSAQKLLQTQGGNIEEIKNLIERVGKLVELPQGEVPTVATVTDLEKLKDQPFFNRAEKGDKVIVYQQAKKAILYRPSINKIIDIAPVNIAPTNIPSPTTSSGQLTTTISSPSPTENPTVASPSPTLLQTLKVIFYNGTTTIGLTKKVEDLLKEKAPHAQVVDKDNAKKNDYAKTLLIDLSGNRKDEAANLAKIVGAEISSLPAGETKPENADFLIIVGADKK